MSIPKLVEYATTIYVNSPRKQVTNLQNIQERIQNFIAQENVNEFMCSDPFDNWEYMTMSEKRTAAAQIRKLVDTGVIEKVNPDTKSHRATVYKKAGRE